MSEKVKRGEEVADLFKDVEHVNELVDGYACRFPGGDTWGNRLEPEKERLETYETIA
ncbi:MAG: hypothetical protein ACJ8BW_39585 [Ktedonobacteraceae bacterium]